METIITIARLAGLDPFYFDSPIYVSSGHQAYVDSLLSSGALTSVDHDTSVPETCKSTFVWEDVPTFSEVIGLPDTLMFAQTRVDYCDLVNHIVDVEDVGL